MGAVTITLELTTKVHNNSEPRTAAPAATATQDRCACDVAADVAALQGRSIGELRYLSKDAAMLTERCPHQHLASRTRPLPQPRRHSSPSCRDARVQQAHRH